MWKGRRAGPSSLVLKHTEGKGNAADQGDAQGQHQGEETYGFRAWARWHWVSCVICVLLTSFSTPARSMQGVIGQGRSAQEMKHPGQGHTARPAKLLLEFAARPIARKATVSRTGCGRCLPWSWDAFRLSPIDPTDRAV